MALIKSELIKRISLKNPHLYEREIERLVSIIFNEITQSLAEGKRCEFRGMGAFSVSLRQKRVGRNPRTGESVIVQEKLIPKFRMGKELRIRLNSKADSQAVQEPDL
tara:strand:+ start:125 stop:445 length:321 start_codon:yes stop_codon:yes gene_type:complete